MFTIKTMKVKNIAFYIVLLMVIIGIVTCQDREITNPFDTKCPQKLFNPLILS
jgi:hypothetical protein